VKASFFPNSAALVLIALALGSLLMGQPYSPARADVPPHNLDATPYDLLITNARIVDGSGNRWYRAGRRFMWPRNVDFTILRRAFLIGSSQTQSMLARCSTCKVSFYFRMTLQLVPAS